MTPNRNVVHTVTIRFLDHFASQAFTVFLEAACLHCPSWLMLDSDAHLGREILVFSHGCAGMLIMRLSDQQQSMSLGSIPNQMGKSALI